MREFYSISMSKEKFKYLTITKNMIFGLFIDKVSKIVGENGQMQNLV